jgi:N-sulfoglucosamine sulfohydrolase
MATATKGTVAYRRMRVLANTNPEVAKRLDLFEHRVSEELYNYAADPDALTNLIDRPEHRAERDRLTKSLEAWMVKTGDPMLEVFRARRDPAVREAYMVKVEKEAAERKTPKNEKRAKKAAAKGKRKKAASK